jgi:hypothetical protein
MAGGPCHAAIHTSAQVIGTMGALPPAAAMVVMLVAVGCWRLGGAILWGGLWKTLASGSKIEGLKTLVLARNCTSKLRNSDFRVHQ